MVLDESSVWAKLALYVDEELGMSLRLSPVSDLLRWVSAFAAHPDNNWPWRPRTGCPEIVSALPRRPRVPEGGRVLQVTSLRRVLPLLDICAAARARPERIVGARRTFLDFHKYSPGAHIASAAQELALWQERAGNDLFTLVSPALHVLQSAGNLDLFWWTDAVLFGGKA